MLCNSAVVFLVVLLLALLQGCSSLLAGQRLSTLTSVGASSVLAARSSHRPLYHQSITRFRSNSRLYTARSTSGGGATKLDTRTVQKTATKTKLKEEIDKNYRLVLHDDTVHTIQQVCEIVSATCPLCSGARAYEVTLEVHMNGAGTICVANKKLVTEYTQALQAAGLTVSMAPDDEFESGGDEDEGSS